MVVLVILVREMITIMKIMVKIVADQSSIPRQGRHSDWWSHSILLHYSLVHNIGALILGNKKKYTFSFMILFFLQFFSNAHQVWTGKLFLSLGGAGRGGAWQKMYGAGRGTPPFPTVRGGAGKGSKSAGQGGARAGNSWLKSYAAAKKC